MNVREHNRTAWNRQVEYGNEWTLPVTDAEVAAARRGDWRIFLTPTVPVPREWFPDDLQDLPLLCLASGGGQQGPILSGAGAKVTVLDNSPKQLGQDRTVAGRNALEIETVEGDMADLSMFPDATFDLIFHPVSNTFAPDIRPVWREAYRVLRPGGALLSGFDNPIVHIFDGDAYERGELRVAHALPYSDAEVLSEAERKRRLERGSPLEFGHTLEDQIGGQIDAGFVITGFYEDAYPEEANDLLGRYTSTFIATRASKA